jgi:hypothetical protein
MSLQYADVMTRVRLAPLLLSLVVAGTVSPAWAQNTAQLRVVEIVGVEPGWVRAYVRFLPTQTALTLHPSVRCSTGSVESVKVTSRNLNVGRGEAMIDLRSDLAWLGERDTRVPCKVSELTIELRSTSGTYSRFAYTTPFWMDVPFASMTQAMLDAYRNNNDAQLPSGLAASVTPSGERRWRFFAPRIFLVEYASNTGLIEVEELASRGTLALRALRSYRAPTLGSTMAMELFGGAELLPGFSLGLFDQGVSRPQSSMETSNPGRNFFAGSATVLPAPPLVSDAQYFTQALDQRGVRRCVGAICLHVSYDAANHQLRGLSPDVKITSLESPLPTFTPAGASQYFAGPTVAPLAAVANLGAQVQTLGGVWVQPALGTTSVSAISRRFDLLPRSPQEIVTLPTRPANEPPVLGMQCGLDENGQLTAPLASCAGFSTPGFRCPTERDPLKFENLPPPPGTATEVGLYSVLTPYPIGRDNVLGTCGTNALVQHAEAVLNRYRMDLAPKRAQFIDGDRVLLPEPPIQLSQAAAIWATWTLSGRRAGSTALDGVVPLSTYHVPSIFFPAAYWPVVDGQRAAWLNAAQEPARVACREGGAASFWADVFCASQGQPTPAMAYSWSRARGAPRNPLTEGATSVANAYLPLIELQYPIADPRASEQFVISELRRGVPVTLGYASARTSTTAAPVDANGKAATFRSDMGWYLPPSLAGCGTARLRAALAPGGGHAVNIVGVSMVGNPTNPDPVNSYFVLQNNWGKTSGRQGFHVMSFAAFRFLATSLRTFRLDRSCWSSACARPLPGKPADLEALLMPDAPSSAALTEEARRQQMLPQLAGTP